MVDNPLVDLRGHGRKVTLLNFHPTANNVLCSTSADFTVRLWDIQETQEIMKMEGESENLIQDLAWSYTGNSLATSCMDKVLRIYDARSGELAQSKADAHEGSKSVKLVWLGKMETLISVGFSRYSQRQLKLWDPRNMDVEVKKINIDQEIGVIIPFFDEDTGLLYLCGKVAKLSFFVMCLSLFLGR